MDDLLLKLTNEAKHKSVKRKRQIVNTHSDASESRNESDLILAFQNYIHKTGEPEKDLLKFCAAERLGHRSSSSKILKISNLFPLEVAEGCLIFYDTSLPSDTKFRRNIEICVTNETLHGNSQVLFAF